MNDQEHDPRDELWRASYETFYFAYYFEILSDRMVNRWQVLDVVTRVIVALTASGSAISGWALWNNPSFRLIWIVIAGIGACLAIVHTSLGVPGKLKDWGEGKRWFAEIRIELETLRYRMRIDPKFPIEEYTREFIDCRERYGAGVQLIKNDIIWTRRLGSHAQSELDDRLGKRIAE